MSVQQSSQPTLSPTDRRLLAWALGRLLACGFVDPGRRVGACRELGISEQDFWSRPTLVPRSSLRNVTPLSRPPEPVPYIQPRPYRPPVVPPPRRVATDRWCAVCTNWLAPECFEGPWASCTGCRERARTQARRRKAEQEAREQAARRLTGPLTRLLTMKVRADGTGLEVCCRQCGEPVRDGNEVGGIVCMSCTTSGGPA